MPADLAVAEALVALRLSESSGCESENGQMCPCRLAQIIEDREREVSKAEFFDMVAVWDPWLPDTPDMVYRKYREMLALAEIAGDVEAIDTQRRALKPEGTSLFGADRKRYDQLTSQIIALCSNARSEAKSY